MPYSLIAHMRAILNRGGDSETAKSVIMQSDLYRSHFTQNSKVTIDNMFREHTVRRYMKVSTLEFKTVVPTSLVSIKVNNVSSFSGTVLGIVSICLFIFGVLYFFQYARRGRHQDKINKILIDETKLRYLVFI
jgi:hypothetical protein